MFEMADAAGNSRLKFSWLFSWQYDTAFFFAPIVLSLFLCALVSSTWLTQSALLTFLALQAFGLGPFHQGATWFHYLDKQNRSHYLLDWKNRLIFFFAPALILLLTLGGRFLCPVLVYVIYIFWSVQHLVQQNFGILLLYHNHNSGEAIVPRKLEATSLHSSALLCTAVFCYRIFFPNVLPTVANSLFVLLLLWAVWNSAAYLYSLHQQWQKGAYLNFPALLFWLIAQACLLPICFWGSNYSQAFLFPLILHWMQYIGLNYIIVKRKYPAGSTSNLPSQQPLLLFALAGLFLAGVVLTLYLLLNANLFGYQLPVQLLTGLVLGLGMVHYYQDAVIWRFRETFPRQSLLPYLRTK